MRALALQERDAAFRETGPERTQERELRLRVCLPEAVEAPVNAGQTLGYAEAVLNGEVLARTPIAAVESAQRRGLAEYWQWLWKAAGSLPLLEYLN